MDQEEWMHRYVAYRGLSLNIRPRCQNSHRRTKPMNQDNAVAEALERLAALATPGPWCGYSEPEVGLPYGLFAGIIGQSAFMQMEPLCAYDIDLIVALRNNLPTIIAALKAQRVDEGGVS